MTLLPPGPAQPDWPHDAVHLWQVDWSGDAPCHDRQGDLTGGERAQLERMSMPEARRRFLTTRRALRVVLSCYLNEEAPARLALEQGVHGKPALGGDHRGQLGFNLSHSGRRALIAVSDCLHVGVDLETHARQVNWSTMGRRVFTPEELHELRSWPASERSAAALRLWVRKEAYTKARGTGFTHGFRHVRMATAPVPECNGLLQDRQDPSAATRWWLQDLPQHGDYSAALALYSDRPLPISQWRFTL